MIEVIAAVGVATAGALWRIAFTQGSMKRGMEAILREVQLLRSEVAKDIVIKRSRGQAEKTRNQKKMNCYHCKGQLIWKAESNCAEDFPDGEFNLHTTLTCEDCKSYVEIYSLKS